MAAMTISSVGVRLMDDFDTLPIFDSPPLDGPTTKVGSLARGVPARAIEKVADFLLLEGDDEDGGNSGTLGWADASCLAPTSFPAFYEFASDLPEGANLVVRASPQPGAAALGQISSYDPILLATGLQGDYISMVHRDRDNPSSPQLQGWMLMMTDDRVLLTLKPPLLIIPALGLPENAQLRVRSAPEATAPELGQLSAAPGSIFESAEQCEGWVRVLMDTSEASAWMSTAAKGMQLLQPAQRQTFVMDPELVAQHGEGVKLAVRSAPSQEGIHLGELTCKGRVHCVGERGPWLRVLYQGYKEAWMLACTGAFQLLVRADSIGGDASSSTNSGEQPLSVSRADSVAATPKSDGHRYMVCAKKATVRTEPEFYAMEVGYAAAESIVRVLDEKEEINHAKQTKDVWVRGQLAGVSSADGGGAAAAGSVLEGWIMSFSTKRGATLTDAPDALAAQVEFLKQEEAARAAVAPQVTREPSTEEAAAPTPAAPVPAPKALAPPPESSTKAGGYMRAEGILKLREEADSLSMELSTITAGELVRVVETSGLWVRVSYRGSSKGWALTANKRGLLLSPVDASAANAAEFDTQEASAAAAAARGSEDGDSAADERGEDNRPLTSAKAGSMAPSPEAGNGKEDAHDVAHMPSQPPPPAPTTPANASAAVDFMKSAGPLKIREQADPYSMEMGTTETGDTVKVLEVSDKWVRVAYRGREDGWILVANKRGTNLFPVEGDSAAAAEVFDAQEERYAAEAASATESPSTADDDDRPLSGAKPAASCAEAGHRPLDTGSGKGSWEPPSEFPTGHKVSQPPEGMDKNKELGCVRTEESAASSGTGQAKFMQALGPLKLRDEADPFSMELCVVDKGAIVKVLEISKLWVRVRYHGREDGWVLTANKRGPMLDSPEDASSAAAEFDAQEASYVAAAETAVQDPDDRPLNAGGGKGSWAPPSEFPPGEHGETRVMECDSRGAVEMAVTATVDQPLCEGADAAGKEGTSSSPEYMIALGPLKLRDEADPFSMELYVVDKGGIVKVLETSKLWVRVRYHGREDGWVLTANKRGPMLDPLEDASSAAKEFDDQEASYAASSATAEKAVDPDDRPLGGGKGSWAPPSEFPPGGETETVISDGDSRGVIKAAAAGVAAEPLFEGADDAGYDVTPSPEYMTALGPVKLREESDPFSIELGVVDKGDIVKVLQTSKLWVRVGYHGREDGWVLTANKRGPMLGPLGDASSASAAFDDQEGSYAASSAAAAAETAVQDPDDRPLNTRGGKGSWAPPSEFPPGGHGETVISDSKSQGTTEAAVAAGAVDESLCEVADADGKDGTSSPEYMTALGPLKLREEEDPCSMELGVVDKGGIVKILQTSKQWVRVRYHGREDGWVLTANKRGPMLEIHEDVSSAAKEFDAQEASHVAASAVVDETAVDPDDRPLGGGKGSWAPPCEFPPGVDGEAVNSEGDNRGTKEAAAAGVADEPRCEGADFAEKDGTPSPEYMTALGMVMTRDEADSSSMGLSKVAMAVVEERMVSRADRKSTNEGVESNAPGDDRPIGGGSGVGRPSGLNDDDNGAAVPPIKPWQRRQKGSTRSHTPSEGKDGAGTQDVVVGGDASAPTQEKPWQKKKREAFMSGCVGAVTKSGSGGVGDGNGNDADDVVGVGSDVAGGVEAGSGDGEGTLLGRCNGSTAKFLGDEAQAEAVDREGVDDVQGLEACLEERDWKKRVAAFEGATRACRDGGNDTTAIVGPLLPRMLQDKNVQAVEAALEVLLAYLPLRSPMGEEEGAALSSALAERALCCGRGQVEDKADEAAKVLLRCDSGELAGRGAWLTLAARVGGLENEFFPPLEDGGVGGRVRSKAAIAASAPKAVAGCVRAMKAAIDGAAAVSAASAASGVTGSGAVVAGGGDSREAVYAAATALLASQKVPLKMAGVSLAKSLFAAEGQMAKDDLGVEEMEPRIKSQVERAFAEAKASAAKPAPVPGPSQSAPALAASPPAGEHASRKVDATVESGGDPANDALIATNVRADTSIAAEGDTGSLSEQPSADRDLSATPERAVKRPDEAAATGSPVVPRSRTPGRSPRTPVRGLPTPIPDSTRHFFKPATARRYTGYRALLAYGARTPLERETQFLGGQMLVLPDGQRSAWDDILDAVLRKCPPPTPFRRRRVLSDFSTPPSGIRDGYPSPLLPLSSPSKRSVASPAPTGLQYGVAEEARGGAVDADEKQDDSGDSLRCTSNTVGGIVAAARMAGQGSSVIARPVDGSLRERIAKLDARNPRKDGERGHALRDYRSWTGGMDGISSGAGDSTMGVMSSGGSAREGNLGSTASASNLQSREEASDNLSRQIAVKLDAENNSQGRGQMVRRRPSRGQSVGARLSAERDSLDLIAKAETAEFAARAVETRDATDVFFAEFRARRLASNEHGALANGRSLAVAHEAEPGAFGTLPVVNAIPGFVGDSRGSSSRLAEPHRPHADSGVASGDVDEAVGDVVDEWPMSSGTVTEEGHLRLSRTSSGRESQPRPSELEANETPFGTPAGSPELSYDSDAEYLSLRSLLDKAGLRKYFRKFRHKEIRAEDLKYLSEEDLEGIGLPLGARKRLLVEVYGIPSSTRETLHSPPSPASVATFSHRRGEDERSERDSQASSRASGGESFRDEAFSPRARVRSQASSRSSKTDSLTSEQILSPQRNASGMRRSATAARIPAPATTGVPVRRASSVSLHSAHARSRQQEEQQRYHTTGGGEGGRETNHTEGSARVSLRGQADVRATSAGSGPSGSSPFFGGRRRERSTIAGSGAEERLAKAVAAERALNATAAAVNQLQDNPSSVPTRPSGIPRRAPGASRLRAPTTRGGRSTGVGGISPLTRSRDGGREQSASAAVVTDPPSGEGQQREMAVPPRRISRTLQAPRERRTSMSRRPNQA